MTRLGRGGGSTESAKSSDSQGRIVDARSSDPLREVLLCGAVFATSLCVYLLTLSPTVALGDSPELAVAAHRLGIAHPTGYPLYTLLGHLWLNLLPVGDVAWRMNLLSALFGAGAVALLAAAARRLSGNSSAAFMAAGLLAFSPTFWSQCTVTEVYSLHVLVLAGLMWLWSGWEESSDPRWLYGLAAGFGLGLTHHVMTILLAPAIGLAVLSRWPQWLQRGTLLRLAGCFLGPLLLYSNLEAPDQLVVLKNYVLDLLDNFGVAAVGLALLGAAVARRSPRKSMVLGLAYLTSLAFAVSYGVVDVEPFFLGANVLFVIWAACGAAQLSNWVQAVRPEMRTVLQAVLCMLPLISLATHFADQDRHEDYRHHDHAVAVLSVMPRQGILLTEGPEGYAPVYASLIEGLRPDVTVVDMYLRIRNDYGEELERVRHIGLPPDWTRDMVVTLEAARLAGGSRPLRLMPQVPDLDWEKMGLFRLRGGMLDKLLRREPDLRVDWPGFDADTTAGRLYVGRRKR